MVWNNIMKIVVAVVLGVLAVQPAGAITQEELVYKHVQQYISGDDAAAIAQEICDAAYTYHVDPIFVAAVFATESRFNSCAVSEAGAIGIAQLMPATAAQLQVNPYNRKENIYGGTKYLGEMVQRYRTWDKPFEYAEAAYNAGPNAVDRARGIPNYRETRNYVQAVEKTRHDIWRIAGRKANDGKLYDAAVTDEAKKSADESTSDQPRKAK